MKKRLYAAVISVLLFVLLANNALGANNSWVEDTIYWTAISGADAKALLDSSYALDYSHGASSDSYAIIYYNSTQTEFKSTIEQVWEYSQTAQLQVYAVDAASPNGEIPNVEKFMYVDPTAPVYFNWNGKCGATASGPFRMFAEFKNNLSVFDIPAQKTQEELLQDRWQEKLNTNSASQYYQKVYQNNLKMSQTWLNPGGALLDAQITPKIQELSDKICVGATTDEDKVHQIREWIASNIAYDNDYYYKGIGTRRTQSEDVILYRRTVCEGYTNLTRDLVCAQNIPCVYVRGNALGGKSTDSWSASEGGEAHAWNEVLLNGRWVVMDNTWDTHMRYEDGIFISSGSLTDTYFDPEIRIFSLDHETTKRGETLSSSAPSQWAMEEIQSAIAADIVPNEVQHSYQSDITRRDFCALLMSGVAYAGKDNTKTAVSATPFPDCEDETVLAAAALGLVNGRSDGTFAPDASITRQEAAVMLANCAELLGLHSDNQGASFKDSASFPSWSKGSIETVAALNVMNGVDGNFVPLGNYTREQAIVTVWRMLTALE